MGHTNESRFQVRKLCALQYLAQFCDLDKMRVNVELVSSDLVESLADRQDPARHLRLGRVYDHDRSFGKVIKS